MKKEEKGCEEMVMSSEWRMCDHYGTFCVHCVSYLIWGGENQLCTQNSQYSCPVKPGERPQDTAGKSNVAHILDLLLQYKNCSVPRGAWKLAGQKMEQSESPVQSWIN